MAQEEAAERFWDFAVPRYGQSEAQAAFLRLQDQGGADVPMLLWCLWCAAEGRNVTPECMAEATRFSVAWREAAVLPLRHVRKRLKHGLDGAPEPLTQSARARVAETEQALERLQMEHLARLAGAAHGAVSRDSATAVLSLYAKAAGISLDAGDVRTICGSGLD